MVFLSLFYLKLLLLLRLYIAQAKEQAKAKAKAKAKHEKDEVLLIAIKDYLNCGYCYLRKKENLMDFKVTKFSDITDNTFFSK